jgi:hypothetical protein
MVQKIGMNGKIETMDKMGSMSNMMWIWTMLP